MARRRDESQGFSRSNYYGGGLRLCRRIEQRVPLLGCHSRGRRQPSFASRRAPPACLAGSPCPSHDVVVSQAGYVIPSGSTRSTRDTVSSTLPSSTMMISHDAVLDWSTRDTRFEELVDDRLLVQNRDDYG